MRPRQRPASHRRPRPRYRRIGVAVGAVGVTLTSVLGATGVLPTSGGPEAAQALEASSGLTSQRVLPQARLSHGDTPPRSAEAPRPQGPQGSAPSPGKPAPQAADEPAVPPRSGKGKRVVFDISDQRVWLVSGRERVRRTYLVSGSLTDNLRPGTYEVYSRSRDAIGIDDSGTMKYMVRFAHGTRAAIGFHDIPVLRGEKVQTRAELGTPQSHGCIRQWRPDAKALWDFAPVGTTVVVVG